MQWVRIALCLILFGSIPVVRAHAQVEADPGYVDFSDIESWFESDATIEVNIRGALLDLVAEASRHEDPEFARLLRKLKGVFVRGYSPSSSQISNIERHTSELRKRLESRGWETVTRVRENDERVDMFVRIIDDNISGLMVMAISEDETIFLNVVGDIDPAEIGRIGSRFQIEGLDGHTGGRASRY